MSERISPQDETRIRERYDERTAYTAPQVVRRDMFKLLAELDVLRGEVERAAKFVQELVDGEPCHFDHSGFCQAHYFERPCSNGLALEWLAARGVIGEEPNE